MQEQIIEFNTAILAKEKLFDLLVIGYYMFDHEEGDHIKTITEFNDYEFPKIYRDNLRNNFNGIEIESDYEFVSAPSQSLLQRWLRERHNIDVDVSRDAEVHFKDEIRWIVMVSNWNDIRIVSHSIAELKHPNHSHYIDYKSYEEAMEKGLIEALKLI